MAKKNVHLTVTDYISAMYTTAQNLGFNIESIADTVSDKANNLTSTIITGYKAIRKDIQFYAHVEKNTTLSSLQLVAKELIDKMRSAPKLQNNKDKDIYQRKTKQPTADEITEGGYSWAKVGSSVYNKRNGDGIIESIDGIIIQVKYHKNIKRYIYPDAILEGILMKKGRKKEEILFASSPEVVNEKKRSNISEIDSSEYYITFDQPQPDAESIQKYLLTDEKCVSNKVCPKCKYTLWLKRYNIPVYNKMYRFISYYIDELYWCPTCKVVYMTEETYSRIQKRVLREREYIRPSNIRTMVKKHPERYLNDPVLNQGIQVDTGSVPQGHEGQQIINLAATSFLSNEGYSISVSETERHKILEIVVQKYGKRRVTDHLRFLIRTRQAQREGYNKYANAISIWTNDLDYVVNL